MRIPTRRLVLTGGAIAILLAVGIGFVAASSNSANHSTAAALTAPTAAPGSSGGPVRPKIGQRLRAFLTGKDGRRLGLGGRLVHVTATVLDKDGNLIQVQLDHGTIQAIGDGTLTVSEAGGTSVTVSTDSSTLVRIGRDKGALSDLKVGQTIFVQSRTDGGTTLAKHILEVPAAGS